MNTTEKQALKTIGLTLFFLLTATTLLFAGVQESVISKVFTPDRSRPLLVKVRGDGAEVAIGAVERGREGRARYRYDEGHFSGTMEWDPAQNRFETNLDMEGLDFNSDDKEEESTLDIMLPGGVPIDLDFTLKAGVIDLDADGLEFNGLEISLWAGELQADFPTVSRNVIKRVNVDVKMGETRMEGLGNLAIEVLDVNGFAGVCYIDLTGSITMQRQVRVDMEMGEITVVVPEGAAVEARISKLGFLAEVDLPRGWDQDGRYAYSPGALRGEADIRLDLRGGIGQITIVER
ncbi:hypothetical protein ACFL44_00925 [Gemmatimonadota bacterium]